jgi:hypothetical protein
MDIWEVLDRDVSDTEKEEEVCTPIIKQKPLSYEIFLKSLGNHPFIKKFNPSPPSVEQAHRDFQRILNAQKFRVWVLRHSSGAPAESEFENAPS